MVAKRGRPSKTNDTISINDLTVDFFLAKKTNNYGAVICYFKVTDSNIKIKLQRIKALEEDDLKIPDWKTEKRNHTES